MFDENSRYRNAEQYTLEDRRGRTAPVVAVPEPRGQIFRGFHGRKQGQRLDHLAARYLDEPTGFWRLCDFNDALWPEALSEQGETGIPQK